MESHVHLFYGAVGVGVWRIKIAKQRCALNFKSPGFSLEHVVCQLVVGLFQHGARHWCARRRYDL